MIDRCPNCGQSVRPTARFCTSCGFRLPEQPAETAQPAARSPFETTSTVSPWWRPSQQPETPAEREAEPSQQPESQPAPVAGEPAVTAEGAPTAPSELEVEAPQASSAEIAGETLEAEPAHGAVPSGQPQAPLVEEFEAPPVVGPASWEETVAAVAALQQREEAPAPVIPGPLEAGAGEPLKRAEELLDQLRALLPQLAARREVTVDPEVVAAGLEAAREELAMKRATFDTLGEVAERARSHPRDLDVMLDLVARAGDIIELKAAYTRALAAIDDALAELRKH